MSKKTLKPDEEEPTSGEQKETPPASKHKKAFANVRRFLTDDDLTNPAVTRLLLDDLEQAEQRNIELEPFRERFHRVDKERAVLETELKKNTPKKIGSIVCLAIGGTLIGLSIEVFQSSTSGESVLAISLCVFGGLLIITGILLGVIK